jgi:hypothetical protein
MARYRSVFPRAKPVIYIRSRRPRRTGMASPIVKLIAVASIALAVMAGVMASGRAHDTCATGLDSGPAGSPGGESRSLDLGGCARPPATLAGSMHS